MYKDILKTLKINHYVKNLIVFVPLIFSLNFLKVDLIVKSCIIFVAFCLISSCVYVMNDLVDIEKDRLHPEKCKRPIASGKISKKLAIVLFVLLLIFSVLCCCLLDRLCLLMVVSYFVLNVFYSLNFKNLAIIDVFCIALGFIFRVVAGCCAIKVLPSPLVILLTFFVSMFFTFTKRKLELELINNGEKCRKSLKSFDIQIANYFVLINAILSISFYFTYVLDETTIKRAESEFLYLTAIPFTLIVFRLLLLIFTTKEKDDPIHFIEKDSTIKALFLFYLVVLAGVLIL